MCGLPKIARQNRVSANAAPLHGKTNQASPVFLRQFQMPCFLIVMKRVITAEND